MGIGRRAPRKRPSRLRVWWHMHVLCSWPMAYWHGFWIERRLRREFERMKREEWEG